MTTLRVVLPVPEKMPLEMVVDLQIGILDGQSSSLFSKKPFEKRPVLTIEDSVLHSDDYFESRLLRNGLRGSPVVWSLSWGSFAKENYVFREPTTTGLPRYE